MAARPASQPGQVRADPARRRTGRPAASARGRVATLLRLTVLACLGTSGLTALAGQARGPGAPPHPGVVARGQEETPSRDLGLAAAVRLVLDRNPLSRATRLDERKAQLDVDLLEDFWALPRFGFEGTTGLVPGATGDVFFSPDNADVIRNLGPFFRAQAGFVVPLFGFGRLKHARAAARDVLDATAGTSQRTRDELAMQTIRVYWGLAAANELLVVVQEMNDTYYDDLLVKVEEKLESFDIDPNDAYEVRSARYDIDKAYLDAVESRRLAARALADLLEGDPGTVLRLTDERGPEIGLTRDDLPALESTAERQNPQLRAVRAAAAALDAAMQLERSERWPLLLLGGGFGYAAAPGRDDQTNPFVWDEFNYKRLGAALNVRWDLSFARHAIEVTRRQIQRDATLARAEALRKRLAFDVAQALERVLKNTELLESARETRRTTRRWLRTAFDDFDLGIGAAEPLIKAYRADYRLQALVIETQYLLDVSLAELSLVMGDLPSYLQWVADGQAALD